MNDDLEEYVFCWNCDKKIEPDSDKCPECDKPQFDMDGDEINCQEQLDMAEYYASLKGKDKK